MEAYEQDVDILELLAKAHLQANDLLLRLSFY